MAKKNFTQKDAQTVGVADAIRNDQAPETAADKKQKKVNPKENADTPTERFTARFNKEEWAYLTEYHWQKRVTITDILRRLVQEDMKKHPEILDGIDELNTRPGNELM